MALEKPLDDGGHDASRGRRVDLVRTGVRVGDEPSSRFPVFRRHKNPDARSQLPLGLEPARVVGRDPGRDPVGSEHADNEPCLGRRRRTRDFLGETGHGASMRRS